VVKFFFFGYSFGLQRKIQILPLRHGGRQRLAEREDSP
jgi:hypothetical protein